jgi:thioredoxin reductase
MTSTTDDDDDFAPRIAILGAGPIGIEAALYARYLGYEVAVLEQGKVANNVLSWGHVKMFSPFAMNRSPLGIAALKAQDEQATLPSDDALLTGREYAEQYLVPLAKSDLLAECIHEDVEVLHIGRDGILKSDTRDIDRSQSRFRMLARTAGREDIVEADAVIDTTGVFNQPNFVGHGGIPAVGELDCQQHINHHLPDVLGTDRSRFENNSVLVVGSGYSAATSVVALAELRKSAARTQTTWATRRESSTDGPIPLIKDDRLPQRTELARRANEVVASAEFKIDHFDKTSIVAISRNDATKQFKVTFGGKLQGEREFDEVISNVGYHPNSDIYRELQVEECSAGQGPIHLAEWIHQQGPVDALDQTSPGPQALRHPEPDFFILGSKSFGRNSNFLLSLGLQQISDAFTVIAGREDLDLYKSMAHLIG